MMPKFAISLCVTLLTIASAPAVTLAEANAKFAKGDFPAAVADYETLLREKGPDAAVYYNLGNSHQQLKQYGPAILAYERARLITPRDPDLRANLARVRKAATAFDEASFNSGLDSAMSYLSRDEWSKLVAGSVILLGILSLVCGLMNMKRSSRRVAGGIAGLALLATLLGASALWMRRGEAKRGIILGENAAIRLSPFESAESIGTLGPGKTILLGAKNGGFYYGSVPGSKLEGWLADKDVAAMIPHETSP